MTTGRAASSRAAGPSTCPTTATAGAGRPYAVDGTDVEAARQQLQHLMRDAEADIAEALSNEGWLTVLDGPLHGIRQRRGLAIGYVKTHHRRVLAREHWVRVTELTAGERSGLFAMQDAGYGCYLRVGDPGPWAGPWAGIARLEMPSGIGRDAAVDAADQAAGWLPGFASAPGRSGPGEPDADRGSRTAPASPPGRRAAGLARGVGGGARTQPQSTDGMISTTGRTGGPTWANLDFRPESPNCCKEDSSTVVRRSRRRPLASRPRPPGNLHGSGRRLARSKRSGSRSRWLPTS